MKGRYKFIGALNYSDKRILGYILRYDRSNVIYGDDLNWRVVRKNGTLGKNDKFMGPRLSEWESYCNDENPLQDRMKQLQSRMENNLINAVNAELGDGKDMIGSPTEAERKKYRVAGHKIAKKLAKKYSQDMVNTAGRLLIDWVSDRLYGASYLVKSDKGYYFDWTKAEADMEIILACLAKGTKEEDILEYLLKISDEKSKRAKKEYENAEEKVKKMTELTKKALELEKPVETGDGIKQNDETDRPIDEMSDKELANDLYVLNQVSYLFFRAQDLYTLFMDIAEIGGDMGLSQVDAERLTGLQKAVVDILGEIYDNMTADLIDEVV